MRDVVVCEVWSCESCDSVRVAVRKVVKTRSGYSNTS